MIAVTITLLLAIIPLTILHIFPMVVTFITKTKEKENSKEHQGKTEGNKEPLTGYHDKTKQAEEKSMNNQEKKYKYKTLIHRGPLALTGILTCVGFSIIHFFSVLRFEQYGNELLSSEDHISTKLFIYKVFSLMTFSMVFAISAITSAIKVVKEKEDGKEKQKRSCIEEEKEASKEEQQEDGKEKQKRSCIEEEKEASKEEQQEDGKEKQKRSCIEEEKEASKEEQQEDGKEKQKRNGIEEEKKASKEEQQEDGKEKQKRNGIEEEKKASKEEQQEDGKEKQKRNGREEKKKASKEEQQEDGKEKQKRSCIEEEKEASKEEQQEDGKEKQKRNGIEEEKKASKEEQQEDGKEKHKEKGNKEWTIKFTAAVISMNIIYVTCYFFPYILWAFIHNPFLTIFTHLLLLLLIVSVYLIILGLWHLILKPCKNKLCKKYKEDGKPTKCLNTILYSFMDCGIGLTILIFLCVSSYIITLGRFGDFEELNSLAPSLLIAVLGLFLLKPVYNYVTDQVKDDDRKQCQNVTDNIKDDNAQGSATSVQKCNDDQGGVTTNKHKRTRDGNPRTAKENTQMVTVTIEQ